MQPENALFIHTIRARSYSELKDWDNAITEYSRSIALSEDRPLYQSAKSPEYAEPVFSKQSIEPNLSLVYIPSSRNLPSGPHLEPAPIDLGYSLGVFTGTAPLYVSRARIYAFQGKKNEAIADYTNAIMIAPITRIPLQQSGIYRERCKNLVAFGDLTNAKGDAQVANEWDARLLSASTSNQPIPLPALPQFGLASPTRVPVPQQQATKKPQTLKELMEAGTSILTQAKKNEDYQYANANAIDLFTQAIGLDRNYAPAYYSRGLAHIKQNNLKLAIADFSEAIRLNPEFSLAYSERASAHQENGEPDQALKDFDLALKTDPTLASANLGRGLILLKQQQWKSSAQAFTQTLEADPEMLEALEGRSIARKNLNDLAGSLTDQSRAKRIRDR